MGIEIENLRLTIKDWKFLNIQIKILLDPGLSVIGADHGTSTE
jgi:hypothetical protein